MRLYGRSYRKLLQGNSWVYQVDIAQKLLYFSQTSEIQGKIIEEIRHV